MKSIMKQSGESVKQSFLQSRQMPVRYPRLTACLSPKQHCLQLSPGNKQPFKVSTYLNKIQTQKGSDERLFILFEPFCVWILF